jgi:DNA-binding XRE family transcriptional regulator
MNVKSKPNEFHVLALALENLKKQLDLSNDDLGKIIGIHRNTVNRLLKNEALDPKSKEGEFSLLLIRIYRSLFALNGGNNEAIKHWLTTKNHHIQDIPLNAMNTVLGLARVVNYLDAIRGKI